MTDKKKNVNRYFEVYEAMKKQQRRTDVWAKMQNYSSAKV